MAGGPPRLGMLTVSGLVDHNRWGMLTLLGH